MALDAQTREIIEGLLTSNKVVLFMKGTPAQPQCGFSATTISTLNMLVSDYMTVNILEHPAIREGIKEYGNWPTIPQLYIDGELIGGCDIIQDMMDSGELADALNIAAPPATTPKITVNDSGIEAMRNAIESNANASLHLKITADWTHQINLDPARSGAVQVQVDDITLHMDPWTASRADGLNLILEEELTGTRFAFDNPNAPPPVNQLSVQALKQKLDKGEDVLLIDVRSEEERAKACIDGSKLWNEETMQLIESLAKDREIVLHCHMGGRSLALADALRRRGHTNLHNLTGGIKAWSEEIDPSVPQY